MEGAFRRTSFVGLFAVRGWDFCEGMDGVGIVVGDGLGGSFFEVGMWSSVRQRC